MLGDVNLNAEHYQQKFINYAKEGFDYKSILEYDRQQKQNAAENLKERTEPLSSVEEVSLMDPSQQSQSQFNDMIQTKENEIIFSSLRVSHHHKTFFSFILSNW